MKTIIAGCTYMTDYSLLERAIAMSDFDVTEVVSNTTTGIARLGERWAIQNNIRLKKMTADWQGHGKFAGPYRNEAMAAYADALIAVWDFSASAREPSSSRPRFKGCAFLCRIFRNGRFGETWMRTVDPFSA